MKINLKLFLKAIFVFLLFILLFNYFLIFNGEKFGIDEATFVVAFFQIFIGFAYLFSFEFSLKRTLIIILIPLLFFLSLCFNFLFVGFVGEFIKDILIFCGLKEGNYFFYFIFLILVPICFYLFILQKSITYLYNIKFYRKSFFINSIIAALYFIVICILSTISFKFTDNNLIILTSLIVYSTSLPIIYNLCITDGTNPLARASRSCPQQM